MSDTTPTSNVIDIAAEVERRRQEEAEALAKAEASLHPRKIKECLFANELGDGTLFAEVNRGRFLYAKSLDKWLVWRDHHWSFDTMEERYHGVEAVANVYLDQTKVLNEEIAKAQADDQKDLATKLKAERDEYLKRVKRLRSGSGATNCINYSHRIENPLAIKGDELDENPWLLACKNGVLDLRTGKLRPGKPEDHLLKYCPHDWKGIDAPRPNFEAFLESALDGDPFLTDQERAEYRADLIAFLRRVLGYGITGHATEHIFLVFNGAGRNGKSVLVETIRYVMGDLVGPILAEMLLDQGRASNPNAPSPHIMSLKGLRIAFASETDEDRRFSPGQVKWYSGGDTLKGRDLNAKDFIEFEQTHLLILLTNNLPHAPGDDFAFWQRLKLIPFNYSFVPAPDPGKRNQKQRDENLRDKLRAEASGILAWLVQGCIEWQQIGLQPPSMVTKATEDYRLSEDTLSQFVEDCCETDPTYLTSATDLYDLFKRWYRITINGKRDAGPKQKKFGAMLSKQFSKDKIGGTVKYHGLRLKEGIVQQYPDDAPGR